MPKLLRARVAQDEQEERQIRKLAASRHGPADWIMHARMVALSWDGKRVEAIAKEVQCSAQTVHRRRFDAEGIEGLGDRPRSGRPSRLTERERSKLIALASKAPPGRLERQADEFATPDEIEQATRVATAQLNRRATPWIWGCPPKDHRHYRRLFCSRMVCPFFARARIASFNLHSRRPPRGV
jgi:transposase